MIKLKWYLYKGLRDILWRKSLTISDIKEIVDVAKSVKEDVIVMVDNCYGEFIETKEPTEVGVDIMAGSLIKTQVEDLL